MLYIIRKSTVSGLMLPFDLPSIRDDIVFDATLLDSDCVSDSRILIHKVYHPYLKMDSDHVRFFECWFNEVDKTVFGETSLFVEEIRRYSGLLISKR